MALTDNDIVNYLRRSQQYASDRAELIVDAIEEGRDIPYDVAQECVNILYLNYGINHAKPGLSDFELEKLIEYANAYYGLNDIAAVVADPYETSIKLLGSDTPAAITDEEVLEIVEDVVAKIDLADRLIDDTAAYNNQTYSSSHIETLLALKANVEDLPESEFTQEYKDDVEANTIFRENFTHQDISHLIPKTQKGAKNGVAPLNSNTKINIEYIPDEIKNRENLIDGWNANTNEPEIPPASPDNEGGWYLVTTAGNTTIDGQTNWEIGDHLISNGSKWVKYRATDKVSGVRGNANVEYDEGLVTIDPDDLDDSATNNKFVSPGQKSAIQNLPADTKQELADLESSIDTDYVSFVDIAARDSYPSGNRTWGMVAYVQSDGKEYRLTKGHVNTDISDNSNWKEVPSSTTVQGNLDAHEADTANPHLTDLEEARLQDNKIAGPINLQGYDLQQANFIRGRHNTYQSIRLDPSNGDILLKVSDGATTPSVINALTIKHSSGIAILASNLDLGGNLNVGGGISLDQAHDISGVRSITGAIGFPSSHISMDNGIVRLLAYNVGDAAIKPALEVDESIYGIKLNSGISVNKILDEDDMISNDASALGTQQSIKAYVDSQVSGIKTKKISLTSTQILSLNTSPVELIAAPGVGKMIQLQTVYTKYNFNTSAYGTNTDLHFVYNGSTTELLQNTAILSSTVNSIEIPFFNNNSDISPYENVSIVATNLTGDPTGGDSTVDIYMTYAIIDV